MEAFSHYVVVGIGGLYTKTIGCTDMELDKILKEQFLPEFRQEDIRIYEILNEFSVDDLFDFD